MRTWSCPPFTTIGEDNSMSAPCSIILMKYIKTRFFHTVCKSTWISNVHSSLSRNIFQWSSEWWPPISPMKKFYLINWSVLSDFGYSFSDFESTFQSDRWVFSPNIKIKCISNVLRNTFWCKTKKIFSWPWRQCV